MTSTIQSLISTLLPLLLTNTTPIITYYMYIIIIFNYIFKLKQKLQVEFCP